MGPITSNFFGVAARPFCIVRKQVQRDYAAAVGVVAILLGLIVIGGIIHTYITRPVLIEVAAKRVPDIRQLFEATFR
jgi:mannose/fructose/N-acetylgalactosamine-specific phosphotransferase system component IID